MVRVSGLPKQKTAQGDYLSPFGIYYTNALLDSSRTAIIPEYHLPALDNAARRAYTDCGYTVTQVEGVVSVTYATPRVPNDGLRAALDAAGREVHLAGDCYAPRSVLAATRQGYEVGMAV